MLTTLLLLGGALGQKYKAPAARGKQRGGGQCVSISLKSKVGGSADLVLVKYRSSNYEIR